MTGPSNQYGIFVAVYVILLIICCCWPIWYFRLECLSKMAKVTTISKNYFHPDNKTTEEHARAMYSQELVNAGRDSEEMKDKILTIDLFKTKVKRCADMEVRTIMINAFWQLGYADRVKTWDNIKKLCKTENNREFPVALFYCFYGVFDEDTMWDFKLEKSFMAKHYIKYNNGDDIEDV